MMYLNKFCINCVANFFFRTKKNNLTYVFMMCAIVFTIDAKYTITQMPIIDRSTIEFTNIMQISIPKCGTHLLSKCLKLLTGRNIYMFVPGRLKPYAHYHASPEDIKLLTKLAFDGYWVSHLVYTPERAQLLAAADCAKFFIYRDPRDQLISFIFYTRMRKNVWPQANDMTMNELIFDLMTTSKAMTNDPPGFGIVGLYKNYLAWMNVPGMLSIRFEDLIGPDGGGNQQAQDRTIQQIAKHIGLKLSREQLEHVKKQLFGGTGTFRKGVIGQWKRYFTDEHKKVFKEVAGQLLIDLGYEKDMEW